MNFTHKVPGKQPEMFITSGLRMEGSKLVPIESKSLGQDTLVSWQVRFYNFSKEKYIIRIFSAPNEK